MDNNAQETSKSLHSDEVGVGETICVVLCKKSGEKSFGMGLGRKFSNDTEKPSSNACQIYVSHVVRNSPAYRENVQEGWRIEQVEGRSIEGYDVQSLASLMRKNYTIKVDFAMSPEEQPNENQAKTQAHMLLLERHRASRPENCSLGFGRASFSKQHRRRAPSDLVDVSTNSEDETKIKADSEGDYTDALLHDSCARTRNIEKKRKNDAVTSQSGASRPNKQTKMTVWATRSDLSEAQLFKDNDDRTSPHVKAMDASICQPQHLTSSTKSVSECPGKTVEVQSRNTLNAEDFYTPSKNASGSNDVHSELPSQKPIGESNRQRHSLTTRRLIDMGFDKVEAEASVAACGDGLEKCMAWIAAQLEEKQFISDLNQASIQSELSKRKEAVSMKQKEKELLKEAQLFTSLFPNSFILGDRESNILKKVIDEQIGKTDSECLLRTTLTRLLNLEAQAIKWYKVAARCYLLKIADNLEQNYLAARHNVFKCCAKVTSPSSCTFLKSIQTEVELLQDHLFNMPKIHGGVPIAFLEADESTKFNLEEDGFEVVDE